MNNDWKGTKALKMGQRTYSTRSLHGQVVHELGRRIVTGEINEGAVLPNETELGASFEVSRTALREGIKVLTAKGLLSSRTRTGTRVRPRTEWNMLDPDVLAWRIDTLEPDDFVQDLIEFRQAVEPLAASLAAVRATDADITALEKAYADMAAAGDDMESSLEADLRFHQIILQASGNELLAPLSSMVETVLKTGFRMMVPPGKYDVVEAHEVILNAIRGRDSHAAWKAMSNLLKHAVTYNAGVLAEVDKPKQAIA